MGRLRRSRVHHKNKEVHRRARTSARTKDIDQIHDDLKPNKVEKLLNQALDMELPGLGQFYCVHCARYFIDELALHVHYKSKVHRRRLKELKEPVYTQADAEAAAGMGSTSTSRNADGASSSTMPTSSDNNS